MEDKDIKTMSKQELIEFLNSQPDDFMITVYLSEEAANATKNE